MRASWSSSFFAASLASKAAPACVAQFPGDPLDRLLRRAGRDQFGFHIGDRLILAQAPQRRAEPGLVALEPHADLRFGQTALRPGDKRVHGRCRARQFAAEAGGGIGRIVEPRRDLPAGVDDPDELVFGGKARIEDGVQRLSLLICLVRRGGAGGIERRAQPFGGVGLFVEALCLFQRIIGLDDGERRFFRQAERFGDARSGGGNFRLGRRELL